MNLHGSCQKISTPITINEIDCTFNNSRATNRLLIGLGCLKLCCGFYLLLFLVPEAKKVLFYHISLTINNSDFLIAAYCSLSYQMIVSKFWCIYLENWSFNSMIRDFYDFWKILKLLSLNKHVHMYNVHVIQRCKKGKLFRGVFIKQ